MSDFAELPAFLAKQLKRPQPSAQTSAPACELDLEQSIERAKTWLRTKAPSAVHGERNDVAYKVAARVKDEGISEQQCFALLTAHWNEPKCDPNLDDLELEKVVQSAYKSGQNPVGSRAPESDFEPVDLSEFKTAELANPQHTLQPTVLEPFVLDDLPPRRWIVPDLLARNFVSGIVSPGGMGKTQLVAGICLAVAAGSETPIGMPIRESTPVWYWNQEDDADELRRRVGAAIRHFRIDWPKLQGRLYLDSGVEKPLILAARKPDGRIAATKQVDHIVERIRALGIGVFVFDPLVEFHEANENDNVEMRIVLAAARRIAVEGDCAVLVVAHTRKPPQAAADGFAGDIDSMRGAGAQGNVIRIGVTLYSMSLKDAKRWGVQEKDRHLYVRLDAGKSNISLIDGKPRWLRRVSVPLGAESIGVLEPAALTEKQGSADPLRIIAKTIAAGAGLQRDLFHKRAEVLAAMTEAERGQVEGDKSHPHRFITLALTGVGVTLVAENTYEAETDYGRLTIVKRSGKAGYVFRLGAAPAGAPSDE